MKRKGYDKIKKQIGTHDYLHIYQLFYWNLFLALLFACHGRILCHSHLGGGDLQDLISGKVFDATIKGKLDGGGDAGGDTLGSRTHVGQGLGLAHIDLKISRPLVNTDAVVD